GWLRAAPAVGALLAAFFMALRPPFQHSGRTLLLVVAGFGLATIVFGLSRDFALSLAMLALLGGLDNVSVIIRSTLLLTRTPDMLRGRVNAVHSVFVGISNELGAFESGVAAALLGTVGAVVAGGFGTILVVALLAVQVPELRRLGRLDTHETG
ncbi:MAG: MFS transporter, partial [Chloroflexia bacterium]